MDTRVLEYFLAVAREENITKAAQMLNVTQPTISRQLMQLEEELGVKLFKRSNHKIYLTNDGILFRRRAQEMIDLAEKTRLELTKEVSELTGEISIGCEELKSTGELSALISAFRMENPKVHFKIRSGNNTDLMELLFQGNLDMALLLEPIDLERLEYIRMTQKEEWGVIVNEDSHFAKKKNIKPGELVGTDVITIRDSSVHRELARWSGKYAKDMSNFATYNLVYNAAMMVKEGMGPAICLKLDCEYDGLKFIPFEPKIEMTSVLAWKDENAVNNTVRTFAEFCQRRLS